MHVLLIMLTEVNRHPPELKSSLSKQLRECSGNQNMKTLDYDCESNLETKYLLVL